MIDFATEALITLADAANLTPLRPHVSTIRRWIRIGVRGEILETVRIGGRRLTSREAVSRFLTSINSMNERHDADSVVTKPSTKAVD
ncbi:MAG: DUF1580 domain-containing protein [Planctomycetaceae bacterium]|nr:DUF1580 domain-containing protein [Planctomycetaceae bacterium]